MKIEVDSYTHSQRSIGKIFFPIFDLVEWLPKDRVFRILAEQGAFGVSHRGESDDDDNGDEDAVETIVEDTEDPRPRRLAKRHGAKRR